MSIPSRPIDGRTISGGLMLLVAIGFISIGFTYPYLRAHGDYGQMTPPPPPPPPPPPTQPPPLFIPPPQKTFTPPIVVPTDVTRPPISSSLISVPSSTTGLVPAKEGEFPSVDKLGGSTDFLLVKSKDSTQWSKISPYAASLQSGSLLVGVRKPSQTGMVQTPIGDIAIYAGADVLISFDNGILRVTNLDGLGTSCQVKLIGPQTGSLETKVFALKPGYELIFSENKLTSRDLKPVDGLARRQPQLMGNDHLALAQISIEGLMNNSSLLANLNQADSGSKERRMLADMSKMAAVLNQVHGVYGYEAVDSGLQPGD